MTNAPFNSPVFLPLLLALFSLSLAQAPLELDHFSTAELTRKADIQFAVAHEAVENVLTRACNP
jgi:hypothetical protein